MGVRFPLPAQYNQGIERVLDGSWGLPVETQGISLIYPYPLSIIRESNTAERSLVATRSKKPSIGGFFACNNNWLWVKSVRNELRANIMKLYLFGGAELDMNQGHPMINLIRETLLDVKPKQVLYIPFLRNRVPEGEEGVWGEGWLAKSLSGTGIEVLDAQSEEDIERADNPVIVISGGPDKEYALEKIRSNERLKELVLNTSIYIGESSGAMIAGEYLCIDRDELEIVPGLGILKNTIIEPHYSERGYQEQLRKEMSVSGAKYGIGIDCVTGIETSTDSFPDSYKIIGQGSVEVVVA